MTTDAIVKANGVAPTPMDLLQLAMSQGADLDKLSKLMNLQERWQATEARKAFVVAMNEFKKAPPTIVKNKHVSFQTAKGRTEYDYAPLSDVCAAVIIGLSKQGISHHWTVEQPRDGWIKVTCILTHESGHSEQTSLMGQADPSGGKNDIQALGSAVTYLQRYTLLSATGLAAGDMDTDGRAQIVPASVNISEKVEWILCAKDMDELKRIYHDAYQAAVAHGDKAAMSAIIQAKDQRKRELQ